jgi:penicillin-binding protein 2
MVYTGEETETEARKETGLPRWRLAGLRILIILGFVVLSSQLWRLQVVQGASYRQQADSNRLRVVPITAPRGIVYDRQRTLLARNIPSFTVSIIPADLPSARTGRAATDTTAPQLSDEQIYVRLASLLQMDSGQIRQMVEAGRSAPFQPVVIRSNVERDTAFVIEEDHPNLPGVVVETEAVRQYLEGPLLAHVLGYVGRISAEEYDAHKDVYDLNDKVGKTGIELTFEEELRGIKGKKQIEVDAAGREVRVLPGAVITPTAGHNLILTLDLGLQRKAQEALLEGLAKDHAKAGVVVALNPQTGEVLALVSVPAYDNNLFSGDIKPDDLDRLIKDPLRPLLNRATMVAYPPGSTFKMVTASAGLQEKVINKNTTVHCAGSLVIPDKYSPNTKWTFPDWLPQGHGDVNVVEALAQSCDIFFYEVSGGFEDFAGLDPGGDPSRLARYAREFGLGARSGVDLPGETTGLVPDNTWKLAQPWNKAGIPWVTGDTYNMGIGQSFLLVTPLQLANVTAAVANGGTLYRPQIVREVIDADGKVVKPFTPEVIRQVGVDKTQLAIVREGMRAAVTRGTARAIDLPEAYLSAAGKTGTAEYGEVDAQGHKPTHAWFASFAPADNPQIALVVFVEGGSNGALVSVPIANKIMRYYFHVPDDVPDPGSESTVAGVQHER